MGASAPAGIFIAPHQIMFLRDRVGFGVTDVEWTTALNHEGRWRVITRGKRMSKGKAEQAVSGFRT